jgi:hypothetical protein
MKDACLSNECMFVTEPHDGLGESGAIPGDSTQVSWVVHVDSKRRTHSHGPPMITGFQKCKSSSSSNHLPIVFWLYNHPSCNLGAHRPSLDMGL